jgi:hypothetical protein
MLPGDVLNVEDLARSTPDLCLPGLGALHLKDLPASVCTAGGANVVRHARVVALRALYELHRLEMLVAAAVAPVLAGNSLFGCRTHNIFSPLKLIR